MKLKPKNHGGRRVGSGKPSFFRGKYARAADPMFKVVPPTSVVFTPKGRNMLDRKSEKLTTEFKRITKNTNARVSRQVVMEALVRKHVDALTLQDILELDK